MKTFGLPALLLTFIVTFAACGAMQDDSPGDQAASPPPAAIPVAAGNNPAPHAPRGLPPEEIKTVDQLPPDAQFSDEEMTIILSSFKVAGPDIAVDANQSERIDCANCYLLFKGKLLEPPFYLTRREGKLFVNGYQVTPFVTPNFGDRGAAKKKSVPAKNHKTGQSGEESEKCLKVQVTAREIVDTAFRSMPAGEREMYILKEFARHNIKIDSLRVTKSGSITCRYKEKSCKFSYTNMRRTETPLTEDGIYRIFKEGGRSDSQRLDDCSAMLRDGLRDGFVFFPIMYSGTPCKSFNSYAVAGDFLPRLNSLLHDSIDPNVKLHRLRLLTDSLGSRYLLANSQR